VLGRPDLNLPDRVHPNAAGQRLLANNVWAVLEPLLQVVA
jgi:acyl-CoA thioesterase-1